MYIYIYIYQWSLQSITLSSPLPDRTRPVFSWLLRRQFFQWLFLGLAADRGLLALIYSQGWLASKNELQIMIMSWKCRHTGSTGSSRWLYEFRLPGLIGIWFPSNLSMFPAWWARVAKIFGQLWDDHREFSKNRTLLYQAQQAQSSFFSFFPGFVEPSLMATTHWWPLWPARPEIC